MELTNFDKMSSLEKGRFIRTEIAKEKLLTLDFSYLAPAIEVWWEKANKAANFHLLKIALQSLLLNYIKKEDSYYFDKIGLAKEHYAAVCVKNIFNSASPELTYIIHEAMSELFQLSDLKYPYEKHKLLYLKPSGLRYQEWGNGFGKITPHADDLYENINTDFLSLTVCQDSTNTPTRCYFPKDFLSILTDEELGQLAMTKANFISGKNVNGILKRKQCNIIDVNKTFGIMFNFDFRIDTDHGERMRATDEKGQYLLDKIRDNIGNCDYVNSIPRTGTFFMIANHKVLHARDAMQLAKTDLEQAAQKNLYQTARLLYRSKGPRMSANFDVLTDSQADDKIQSQSILEQAA